MVIWRQCYILFYSHSGFDVMFQIQEMQTKNLLTQGTSFSEIGDG